MDGITLAWTLAATVFAGIHLFLQKIVANEKRSSAFNGFFMYGISGAMALAVMFSISEIPDEWLTIGIFAVVAGVTHGIGNFIRIESLKYIDSVIYFPINKVLGPLIVLIGGIVFFKDSLTLLQYVGIAASISVPLLLVSSTEKHRQNNLRLGMIFLVVSTLLTAGSTIFTKQALADTSAVLFVLSIGQVAGTISSLVILLKQHGREFRKTLIVDFREVYLGVLGGVLAFFSSYSLLKALSLGLISIVYTIHAHYILVPIVLSIWWYGEHINMRKVAAVGLSFLAIALLI
jgi:drug/metabolite transporter (DMT)-like permease